jgi:hypothetical protein
LNYNVELVMSNIFCNNLANTRAFGFKPEMCIKDEVMR